MPAGQVAEPVTRRRYEHGEGIRFDARTGTLLWVDIGEGRLLTAAPDALESPREQGVGMPLGAVTPAAGGGWLLAAGRGFAHLDESGEVTVLAEVEPEGNRMNDGACDPRGRFYAGSMAYDETPGAASLHRLELDGTVTTVLRDLTVSNGIGWSPDGTTMYLNDSGPGVTYAFDVDRGDGEPHRQRVLIRYDEGVGDGLAIDAEGYLWVPLWGGSAVARYDPAGRRVATVRLPVPQPTDCALAPDGLLYITTASKGLAAPPPDAGRLFAVDVGVTGPAVQSYDGKIRAGG